MREGSEVNGDEVQEKIESTSINQSDELHLIQNENLEKLLNENSELREEVEQTEKLINSPLKIKTIEEFDEIVGKITELGFKTAQEAKEKAEKLGEVKTEEELKYCLNAKKFCYYETALDNFFSFNIRSCSDEYQKIDANTDNDAEHISYELDTLLSNVNSNDIALRINNQKVLMDNMRGYNVCLSCVKLFNEFTSGSVRTFLKKCISSLIKLNSKSFLEYTYQTMLFLSYVFDSNILLHLLSNPDRYNFFQQFHHMLEKNLPNEDKQLFYDYLKSCREKLQNEKYKYLLFGTREKQLTGVVIFEIIASAVVLILSLFNIVNLMWLFYIGIVLTVAVGIRLSYFLLKNYNRFKSIDRAIDVYDLDKIRDFKEPELKKNLTLDLNKEKNTTILSNNKVNINKQNDSPKSGENKLDARHN